MIMTNNDKQTISAVVNPGSIPGLTNTESSSGGVDIDILNFKYDVTKTTDLLLLATYRFAAATGWYYTVKPNYIINSNFKGQIIVKEKDLTLDTKNRIVDVKFDVFVKTNKPLPQILGEEVEFFTQLSRGNEKDIDDKILEVLPPLAGQLGPLNPAGVIPVTIKGYEGEKFQVAIRSGEKYLQGDGTFGTSEFYLPGKIKNEENLNLLDKPTNPIKNKTIVEFLFDPDNQEVGDFEVEIWSLTVDGKTIDKSSPERAEKAMMKTSLKQHTLSSLFIHVDFDEEITEGELTIPATSRVEGLLNTGFSVHQVGGKNKVFENKTYEINNLYYYKLDIKRKSSDTITTLSDMAERLTTQINTGGYLTKDGWDLDITEIGFTGSNTHKVFTLGLRVNKGGDNDVTIAIDLDDLIAVA